MCLYVLCTVAIISLKLISGAPKQRFEITCPFCSNLMQKLNSATSAAPLKKPSLANARNASSIRGSAVKSASIKPAPRVSRLDSSTMQKHNVPPPKVPAHSYIGLARCRSAGSN